MATTPTNLPVPSESPFDFKFNIGKIDEVVTSMGWTYTDRFGQKHYTIEGINYLSQQAMAAFGYVILTGKTFTTGATINNPNEVLLNTADGEYYKWTGTFASGPKVVPENSTPASTGGIAPGSWLGVGDASLRAALAAMDGEKLIGECPDIATLRTIEPSYDKQRITLREHTANTGYGGGQFRAVMSGSSYADNNGTIIKTSGGAAWVRVNVGYISPYMFGALPRVDATTPTAHTAINAAAAAAVSQNAIFDGLGATFNVTGECTINNSNSIIFQNMVLVVTDVAASFNVVRVRNADHTIRRIRIEGGNSKVLGINVESTATGTIVESCKVTNTGLTAIYSTASRVVARNNQTDSCGLLGTGNYRCSIWFNENEHAVMEGNICTNCAWGILMRNTIGTSQGYFNTMRNNIVVSASGTTADCQGISASAQIHLSTTDNIVRGFPNNAIDHQNCFGMIITGNQIHQCNDGVFIGDRSCGRIIISNNNIEACFTGIRYYNPSNSTPEYQNQTFADVQITNNVIYTSTSRAIWVIMTGTTSANFMTNVNGNIVDGNGSAGLGIVMDTVTYGSVSQNQVRRVRGHGIDLASCEGLRVMGNSIADAGFTTTGTYNGINLSNCNRCNASDNYAVGPSMIYSVVLGGGAYNMAYTNHAMHGRMICMFFTCATAILFSPTSRRWRSTA